MDQAYSAIGNTGKFQKILSYIILVTTSSTLYLAGSFPFVTRRPLFYCTEKSIHEDEPHQCHADDVCGNDLYNYHKDPTTSSLNFSFQFDLFCERSYFIPLLGTTFFFGGIMGSTVLSPLPDRLGRAGVSKLIIFITFILHLNLLFPINMAHLLIVFFLCGSFQYGGTLTNIIISEYLERTNSGLLISINNSMFCTNGIISGVFFMLFRDGQYIFMTTSLLIFSIFLLSLKYFVESPRWLVSQNRNAECLEVLRKMAEVNGTEERLENYIRQNPNFLSTQTESSNEAKSALSLYQIFGFKSQQLKLILLTYTWYTCSFAYFGLVLNLDFLEGNFFVISMITFCSEMCSQTISGILADRYGRIPIMQGASFIGGVGFILYELTPHGGALKTVLIFFCAFGFSAMFNTSFIYTPEAFPTSVRSTCFGYLYMISRLGALIVPTASIIIPHAPFVFGTMSFFSAFLLRYLPETMGKEMEDEIPEVREQRMALLTNEQELENII